MSTITFDTYDFVKRLKGAGFSEEQAEVLTDLQKSTSSNTLEQARHDYELDDIATKRDLKELELKMGRDLKELELKIELVRSELKRDIETVRKEISETKSELIRWVAGVGLLQVTLIVGLVLRLTSHI
ncbi:CCDC90 family protein [Methylovulum psychrotolerans]|jgi:predicted transposase YdaD|uniref:DUF1640 domain-containing protein n=1 Tax=Methylovulum psychrotolerans TaxID=1704499 RepID=A0A1Z4C498_9GAMM|nr:DUF1640 domain-containing protein [Methylovulum psychrotolerans]ASF48339.1 DUF1640 domain-containing protein [Methylovulum psychrotolerans]